MTEKDYIERRSEISYHEMIPTKEVGVFQPFPTKVRPVGPEKLVLNLMSVNRLVPGKYAFLEPRILQYPHFSPPLIRTLSKFIV